MGIGSSSGRIRAQLEKLTGLEPLDEKNAHRENEDNFWFGNKALKDIENLLGGGPADKLCKQLVANNSTTKNLQRLIRHTIYLLKNFQPSPPYRIDSENKIEKDCVQELNVVYILRVFIKFLIERVDKKELKSFFDDSDLGPLPEAPTTTNTPNDGNVTLLVVGEGSHQIEQVKQSESSLIVTVNPAGPPSLVEAFLQTLMDFCVDTEISYYTYDLHKEICYLLLVLFSTQMYRSLSGSEGKQQPNETQNQPEGEGKGKEKEEEKEKENGEGEGKGKEKITEEDKQESETEGDNLFTEAAERYYRVSDFMHKMLTNFVSQRDKPTRQEPASLLTTISTAASQLLFLPLNAYSYFFDDDLPIAPNNQKVERSLADLSILLILVLAHHIQQPSQRYNNSPYRKYLAHVQDIYLDADEQQHEAGLYPASCRISYKSLFDVFCSTMTDDSSIILIYLLFHGNPHFLAYVLSRTDYDSLLIPMLTVLYASIEERPQPKRVYMILICLLILSQDTSFNENIQKLIVPSANWFRERFLHDISVGSLISILLIRTIHLNINKHLRDTYLHLNCLATLANMSTSMEDMHPYAAHRFVKLFEMISKKHRRLQRKCEAKSNPTGQTTIEEESAEEPKNETNEESSVSETEMDLMIVESFLHIVLEIINSCLTNALRKNPQLSYALLQEKELFPPHRANVRFKQLVLNIEALLEHFESMLKSTGATEFTTNDILEVIEKGSMTWQTQKYPLQFTYDEEENSERFFTPYVWEVVMARLHNLLWDTKKMKLFHEESMPQQEQQKEDIPPTGPGIEQQPRETTQQPPQAAVEEP